MPIYFSLFKESSIQSRVISIVETLVPLKTVLYNDKEATRLGNELTDIRDMASDIRMYLYSICDFLKRRLGLLVNAWERRTV
jgi:hypothetical protein